MTDDNSTFLANVKSFAANTKLKLELINTAQQFIEFSINNIPEKRLKLLKKMEHIVNDAVSDNIKNCSLDKYHAAIISSNFAGIQDFSDEFYDVLQFASLKQKIMRRFIQNVFDPEKFNINNTGFSFFETIMLYYCAQISECFDPYYIAWCKAVQGNETAKALITNPLPKNDPLYKNHYTIIDTNVDLNESGSYTETSYAIYFANEIKPIVEKMSELIVVLKQMKTNKILTDEQIKYIKYFEQYRSCLIEADPELLEPMWEHLDMIWMDIHENIQIVHCIEYGYGDPLRIKIIPDFSIRLLDDEYTDANKQIETVQKHMIDYFKKFNTELSQKGLFTLDNSMAGIYYLPFQCAMSLHFRFSGQNIPNRISVQNLKGVKIYFDPISTACRIDGTKKLIMKVFDHSIHEELCSKLDAINTIIYHVAAHEFGHAIYNLSNMGNVIRADAKSLLEEPRANLTSLRTLKLLYENGVRTLDETTNSLIAYICQDLRRFASFTSTATRPYTISAIGTYKICIDIGFVKFTSSGDYLKIDKTKTLNVLDAVSYQFEEILKYEDTMNGDAIHKELETMQQETEFIKWLVNRLS